MHDSIYHQSLIRLTEQHFHHEELPWNDIESEQKLKVQLDLLVSHLMDHDMERLLQVLYRVDVSEKLVKEILSTQIPSKVSEQLSDAIIKRLKQKLFYRNKYK